MKEREEEILATLADDPGDPLFVEYADFLRREEDYANALQVCLAGLSVNPGFHHGRLVLARIFFDQSFIPFAVRELELLHTALPNNSGVQKLLDRLAPGSASESAAETAETDAEDTVAETEFDFDEIELIEEE